MEKTQELENRITELERKFQEREAQQLTFPLDNTSKDILSKEFPKHVGFWEDEFNSSIVFEINGRRWYLVLDETLP